jgi:rhodanese-related sulfurtransferase
VAQQLRDQGFSEAYAVTGGFDAWQAIGGPVEPK